MIRSINYNRTVIIDYNGTSPLVVSLVLHLGLGVVLSVVLAAPVLVPVLHVFPVGGIDVATVLYLSSSVSSFRESQGRRGMR